MKFKELDIKGAYLIEPEFLKDDRGFFTRVFCDKEFKLYNLCTDFPQWSISYNKKKNSIRGMHYQKPPHEEVKLVMCTKGGILDVLVDLRKESDSYTQWISVNLTEENKKVLYIPKGIAHGFKTLCDNTDVLYHISDFYHPECSTGVLYNDDAFGIEWGDIDNIVIADKDLTWSSFKK